MSTVLSLIPSQIETKSLRSDKSRLLDKFQQFYVEIRRLLKQDAEQSCAIRIFQNYHQQFHKILQSPGVNQQRQSSSSQYSTSNSLEEDDITVSEQEQSSIYQPSSFMFLRNAWQSKYCPQRDYDAEDHIDRINKIVAMVRSRTNYMAKKENYLYEKEQSNHQHLYENPVFMKIKEELERVTMANEELSQKCQSQQQTIAKITREKSTNQQNLQNLKKKFQQMEKSWIEVSKKNICLEQDSLALKSQNSKSKLTSLRESSDLNMYTSVDLKRSMSFKKINEEQNHSTPSIEQSIVNETSALVSLQNVFIDINLNMSNSKKQQKQHQKANNRYGQFDSQNEENLYLKDVTERVITANNASNERLALSRSDRLVTEASPLKFKHIKNEGGSSRKPLLTSARSVDLLQKTSLNKPKFERTKPSYQHLLRSVGKDGCVVGDIAVDKPSLLKKQNILTDEVSSIMRSFKSPQREFVSRKQVAQ